ncbi:Short-chain dehydrogenase/reductase SDR [uncultured Desulfatiglans sp.]|nr:Short-chain dehydrogenase/reductase SDR [uncultured Desulfatiglans sp.]
MRILILGANSDIARAVARTFAREEKADFLLASRDREQLEEQAVDLANRYEISAEVVPLDATDFDTHSVFYEKLEPKPDGVIAAFGYMGEQDRAQRDFQEARKIVETNYLGTVSLLEIAAADMETRHRGFIIGISSVAGERGRASNYIYGSAKGAVTIYLSGLRNRLSKKHIQVMTVLAGFVDTKMTEHMRLPGLLTASTDEVADDIYRAYKKGRSIVYTRWYWRWIMMIIKSIPEFLFKKLSIG